VCGGAIHLPQHHHDLTAMQRSVIDDVHDDLPCGAARYLAVQYRLVLDDTVDLRIACALCPRYPFVLKFGPDGLQHLACLTGSIHRFDDACEPQPIGPKNVHERAQQAAVRYADGFRKIRVRDGANRLDELARGPSGVAQV
jgi:hypothetical protein